MKQRRRWKRKRSKKNQKRESQRRRMRYAVRRTDEVVKILKAIVALGCVHQVKAQGEEALERTGGWEFVVMVVFALIGMMRILQLASGYARQVWRPRQKKLKERVEAEERQKEEERTISRASQRGEV